MGNVFAALALVVPLSTLAAAPALANAVTGWTGVDGFSSMTVPTGKFVIDTRLNVVTPGLALSPTVNFVAGLTAGHELGIGTAYDFTGVGSAAVAQAPNVVYPWLRGAVPGLSFPGLKVGYMVGGDIPVTTAHEPAAGACVIFDVPAGPGTLSFMGGARRFLGASGVNRLSGNLNYTYVTGNWMFYEENVINQPLGGPFDAAMRGSIMYTLSPTFSVDVNPAILYAANTFSFNPNVGMTFTF